MIGLGRIELTADGFRRLWFHSRRKAALDDAARGERCRRAIQQLQDLQRRLTSPRTRFRERSAVERVVQEILAAQQVESLLRVEIHQREEETFRKEGPGRPSEHSSYRREVPQRFDVTWRVDDASWRAAQFDDGIFPLLTNDRRLTTRELLEAYKRQPKIEKRFTQLKSRLGRSAGVLEVAGTGRGAVHDLLLGSPGLRAPRA